MLIINITIIIIIIIITSSSSSSIDVCVCMLYCSPALDSVHWERIFLHASYQEGFRHVA